MKTVQELSLQYAEALVALHEVSKMVANYTPQEATIAKYDSDNAYNALYEAQEALNAACKKQAEMNKVYVLLRNGKVEAVFATRETAELFKKAYGGWNTWAIVETELKEDFGVDKE